MFVGKPDGKRSPGRPNRRWVDNNKIYLKRDRMGWYGLDLVSDGEPVQGSCDHGTEPSYFTK
jgi:hypothetical protein